MPEILLKPGREKSLIRRHPWIFSGAVALVQGSPKAGETVDVLSSAGEFLAGAAYSPASNIIGRVWTWDPSEEVNSEFFERRLKQAIDSRRKLVNLVSSNAMRLVHGESDGFPGMILDQYDDVYVIQLLSAGAEYWRDTLINIIIEVISPGTLYERSDADVRKLEGLPEVTGLLYGKEPDNPIVINEDGINYLVDVVNGHKSGFYLDQRDNRKLVKKISDNCKVLDCFSYTGGFSINSIVGHAKSVTLVDSSNDALIMARNNYLLNKLSTESVSFIEQDVFKFLRTMRDMGESFDLIILDPPKFAPTISQVERAARGYKDVNLLALKLLKKGGYLMTFSCSGGVSEELFQKIVAGAALDAQIVAIILERLHQAIDHPVALNFPEGAYLKGFLIQKISG